MFYIFLQAIFEAHNEVASQGQCRVRYLTMTMIVLFYYFTPLSGRLCWSSLCLDFVYFILFFCRFDWLRFRSSVSIKKNILDLKPNSFEMRQLFKLIIVQRVSGFFIFHSINHKF